ncbi:hypothetical protein FACS189425_03980 [Clostridia bacterium]|nr:hypothetical protein FACS189425_03980 [Clostridia bacterium]
MDVYELLHPNLQEVFGKLDPVSALHSINVAEISGTLAEKMGLPENDVKKVQTAALIHDLGKTQIPPALLDKHGKFTKEEREVMGLHAAMTDIIIKGKVPEDVRYAAVQHHEKLSGDGTLGLNSDQISPFAKIIAVADVYDAMRDNTRVYKEAKTHDDTIDFLGKVAESGEIDKGILAEFTEMTASIDCSIRQKYPEIPDKKEQKTFDDRPLNPEILQTPEIMCAQKHLDSLKKEMQNPPRQERALHGMLEVASNQIGGINHGRAEKSVSLGGNPIPKR